MADGCHAGRALSSDYAGTRDVIDWVIPEGGVTVVVGVFMDESGTHQGSPAMSVAAYIFEKDQHLILEKSWREALEECELPYFHMVDCAHGLAPFDKMTPKERDTLCRRLIGMIKLRMQLGLVVSVSEKDYEEARSRDWTVSAYTYCIQWIFNGVAEWADSNSISGEIVYFLEAGHRHQNEMNRAMQWVPRIPQFTARMRYRGHFFGKKDDYCGLQAADILAWEWNKDFINIRAGMPRPRRKSLRSLLEKPHQHLHLNKEQLLTMIGMNHETRSEFIRQWATSLQDHDQDGT